MAEQGRCAPRPKHAPEPRQPGAWRARRAGRAGPPGRREWRYARPAALSVCICPKRWDALLRSVRWLAGGIAAVVLAVAVAWVLFVPAADWLAHHDVGSAKGALYETARDNARGRLLTLGAGLFAAGALVFTARNFTLSRRTFALTEQGQVTDRYTKAIEQLGSDKLDVRIGGIYALERIARDSAKGPPDCDGGPRRVHPRALTRAMAAARVPTARYRNNSRGLTSKPPPQSSGAGTQARHPAALTSPARTSSARNWPARTSPARTSPARTSPARTSPARTSLRGPRLRGPH